MRKLIHEFLKEDKNKEYVIDRLKESIDFSELINGKHIKSLEINYYNGSPKGFSHKEDNYELVAKQGLSNQHYICITKDSIDNIGFSSKEYEKVLLVFDDIEKELTRNKNIEQLLNN